MGVIGYYVNCDDALCVDCAPAGFADSDYTGWAGFQGWESPAVIFTSTEADTPTHCGECGELIPHALTPDGARYVAEAVARVHVGDSQPSPAVVAWAAEYLGGDESL